MAADPLLTPGITNSGADPALARTWLAAAHQMARETGATLVGNPVPPDPGRNHYRLYVRPAPGGTIVLRLHASARYVAAVINDGHPHSVVLPYCDVPRSDLFELYGFRVLWPVDLERPLTDELAGSLDGHERRDIAYHRPERVGDVIFNWFD